MTTDRRTVLKRVSAAGVAAALAGCIGVEEQDGTPTSSDGGSGGDGGDGSSDGSSDTSTESTETQGPAGEATIWYSLPDSEIPTREDLIETFNGESHHSVDGGDISDMEQKTTSAIPAGQGPEMFQWAHDWVGDYTQQGFAVDRGDELGVSLDQYTDAAAQAVQYDGKVVGLPLTAETVTLIVNRDIVDQVPETADDLLAAIEEHHSPDDNQYGITFMFDAYFTSGLVQAFGGYYFDPNADPALGLDQEETIEGLQFVMDNFRPYMPNDPEYEPQTGTFAEGNAAFMLNGPWSLATLNENDLDYEVTTFPEFESDAQFTPYTGIQMWYFAKAMEEGGADAAAAREFAEWHTTNEDHFKTLAEEQGKIPVLRSLVESGELPDHVAAFSKTVDQGVPMPTDPRMNDVWAAMESPIAQVFSGEREPEEALTQAAEDARSNWN